MAGSAADILGRRTRLAFLDAEAAQKAIPFVITVLAKHMHWDKQRVEAETELAEGFVRAFRPQRDGQV